MRSEDSAVKKGPHTGAWILADIFPFAEQGTISAIGLSRLLITRCAPYVTFLGFSEMGTPQARVRMRVVYRIIAVRFCRNHYAAITKNIDNGNGRREATTMILRR